MKKLSKKPQTKKRQTGQAREGHLRHLRRARVLLGLLVIVLATALLFLIASKIINKPGSFGRIDVVTDMKANPQPQNVTEFIKQRYSQKYKVVTTPDSRDLKDGEISIGESQIPPIYKAAGYDFSTIYKAGSFVRVEVGPGNRDGFDLPRPIDTAMRNDVIDVLKSFGLTKTGSQGSEGDGNLSYVYTGRGLICEVEPPGYRYGSPGASVNCGRIDAYKAAAEEAAPFVKALDAAKRDPANIEARPSLFLIHLEIKESISVGYELAEASTGYVDSVGSATTLFYRKDGGEWQFFKRTQMGIRCTEFNTDELRKAYRGELCFDYGKQPQEQVVQ